MRHSVRAVAGVLLIMLLPLLLMFNASYGTPEVPTPTVTITAPAETKTITLKPPERTITIRPPAVTVTKIDNSGPGSVNSNRQPPHPRPTLPLPTVRVTVHVRVPGPTKTVTVSPNNNSGSDSGPSGGGSGSGGSGPNAPTRTVTVGPSAAPTETTTVEVPGPVRTVTATSSPRQVPPKAGTIDANDRSVFDIGGDGESSPAEVGFGLLTILAGVGMIIAALWAGYTLGYKERQGNERDFMRALLDTAKRRH